MLCLCKIIGNKEEWVKYYFYEYPQFSPFKRCHFLQGHSQLSKFTCTSLRQTKSGHYGEEAAACINCTMDGEEWLLCKFQHFKSWFWFKTVGLVNTAVKVIFFFNLLWFALQHNRLQRHKVRSSQPIGMMESRRWQVCQPIRSPGGVVLFCVDQ